MARLAITLFALLAAFGCRRHYDPVHDPGRVERFERNLIRLAAADSGCQPVEVQPVRIEETLWVTNTCVGPREYFLRCRSRGRRWANCQWRRIPTVGEAAARALRCPVGQVGQQAGMHAHDRVAVGCGRQMPVQLQCNAVGCGWIAAGPVTAIDPRGRDAPLIVIVPAPQ